jgi:hypothetical protein
MTDEFSGPIEQIIAKLETKKPLPEEAKVRARSILRKSIQKNYFDFLRIFPPANIASQEDHHVQHFKQPFPYPHRKKR